MRLIDADKILQETWDVEIKDMFHMTETVEVVSAIDIEEAPTVSAIPIEWIRKWNTQHSPLIAGYVAYMILDWEKENEPDR